MSIRVACPSCGKRITVADAMSGKRGKCSGCGAAMLVPQVAPQTMATGVGRFPQTPGRASSAAGPSIIRQWHITAAIVAGILLVIGGIVGMLLHGIGSEIRRVQTDMHKAAAPLAETQYGPQTFAFPARPAAKQVTPGVEFYPMTINGTGPGLPMQVYLYLPAGPHPPRSLPCVFIAPAGSRLLYGMRLSEGDMPEHLPYASAGFAVLAYELSGDLPEQFRDRPTLGQLAGPIKEFISVDGGLANAHAAIEFVLKQVPEVDPNRLYTAGHSSAATVALDVAAADPRIRGCCAYAPMCDVDLDWRPNLDKMERLVPGVSGFALRVSPIRHAEEFSCPVFLFHAEDDTRVPTRDNLAFDAALKAQHKRCQFMRAGRGGHFESMMRQGIPAGITWLESLEGRASLRRGRSAPSPDNLGGRIQSPPPIRSTPPPPLYRQPPR